MKDYTEIFAKAIEISSDYDCEKIAKALNLSDKFYCGVKDDEWVTYNWYIIAEKELETRHNGYYAYLFRKFPVALILKECPREIKDFLAERNVLLTEFVEPMCCDENILRQYISYKKVFDESFLDSCDYSFDDERFELVLKKLESGYQRYINAGEFLFKEIEIG